MTQQQKSVTLTTTQLDTLAEYFEMENDQDTFKAFKVEDVIVFESGDIRININDGFNHKVIDISKYD